MFGVRAGGLAQVLPNLEGLMATLINPAEIGRLSAPEHIALIAQLWDSLENDQLPITAAQAAELDRRLSPFEEDSRESVPWADLKAELESRCPWCSPSIHPGRPNGANRSTGLV